MFASFAALALMGQQVVIPLGRAPRQVERARAPIETAGPAWAAACGDSTDWDRPAPPVRIHANTYLVGTCGISAVLVTGSDGHVLIDGGTEAGADLIAANIKALGFAPGQVKYLLHSHEHVDHVGGIAHLQKLTGASLVASAPAAKVLTSGLPASDDPQAGMHKPFAPAQVGRIVADGDTVRLGNVMLTAMATPGHTPGALSWRWESCDGAVCRAMVYADSLTPVSRPAYRFSDRPGVIAAFRASIARLGETRCEILLTPHPAASAMKQRMTGAQPLFNADGCRNHAAKLDAALTERIATEARK